MSKRAFTKFRFWAAAGLVVAFFLPWSSFGGFISFSGYQLAELMRGEANKNLKTAAEQSAENSRFHHTRQLEAAALEEKQANAARMQLAISYLIDLVPIAGLLCIILELKGSQPRIAYLLTGLMGLGLFGLTYYAKGTEILQLLSIGAWITLAAALAAIIGALGPNRWIPPEQAFPVTASKSGGSTTN